MDGTEKVKERAPETVMIIMTRWDYEDTPVKQSPQVDLILAKPFDRIPESQARSMAVDFLRLHADVATESQKHAEADYETLFGMLNRDERTWDCAFHPDIVATARHILGKSCRVVEACCKPNWPGYTGQWPLHVDSVGAFARVPDVP